MQLQKCVSPIVNGAAVKKTLSCKKMRSDSWGPEVGKCSIRSISDSTHNTQLYTWNAQTDIHTYKCTLTNAGGKHFKLQRFLTLDYWCKIVFDVCTTELLQSCQKVQKTDFQSQFSMSTIIRIVLIFFSLKNINLGEQFLVLTFFDNYFF